jgi:3-hydroxybutyryl-CoA dehydratase
MTVSLGTAQRGTRIPGGTVDLAPGWLREYVEAVEDATIASLGVVPPMAVATQSVGALLKGARLPPGAIHASEQLSWSRHFRGNEDLVADGLVDGRAERQGWVLVTILHEITDDEGEIALGGKASIVFPTKKASVPSVVGTQKKPEDVAGHNQTDRLAPVIKVITQEKIDRYAEVSGDHNPLHIDPDFAATTQFRGTVAHGMLVLSYISEVMTAGFGNTWLRHGRLKVRFRGAARPGDTVTASGRVTRTDDVWISCEVACRNQVDELLISGEAEVAIR